MLEKYARNVYQKYMVDPLARRYIDKLSSDKITISAGLIGITIFPALYFHHNFLACFLLLLSGYFDTLDGTVARLQNKTSTHGSVLDIVSDRIVELFVVLGLFSIDTAHRAWPSLLMLGSMYLCITSFLVVGIFSQNTSGKSFHYSAGLMERAEAFIFFIAMIALPKYFSALTILFVLLVTFTAFLRVFQFMAVSSFKEF